MRRYPWRAMVAWIAICAAPAFADDAYFRISRDELAKIAQQKLPDTAPMEFDYSWRYETARFFRPYAVLSGKGEAFIVGERGLSIMQWRGPSESGPNPEVDTSFGAMFVRAPAGAEVKGSLYVTKPDLSGMVRIDFDIPTKNGSDNFRREFLVAKAFHYSDLVRDASPGGAWFRHEYRLAQISLDQKPDDSSLAARNVWNSAATAPFERTYDLMSGGRAVSENLQLDRNLPATKRGEPTVELDKIEGISTAAIDWSKHLPADAKPRLDPLASAIPEDQHTLFFSSFENLLAVADTLDRQGTPALELASSRSEDFDVRQRYERQLGLSMSALSRVLGKKLVRSVAITGSDLYFPTGTDLAILFETDHPANLQGLLQSRVVLAAATEKPAPRYESGVFGGEGAPIWYSGARSADRQFCSYITSFRNVVAVSNSLVQLNRLVEVFQHKRGAITELPEYKFFRTRYPLGATDESALLFLSDATIRRWCGPKWRIASSRRIRDMSAMYDLQADYLEQLVAHGGNGQTIPPEFAAADLGKLTLAVNGVQSSTLGTLHFQTPIVELPITKVTQEEADDYKRWRDNYQTNWRWAFDPIALKFHSGEHRVSADLTVMPLIERNEYRDQIAITRGVKLARDAGDLHDAPLQWVMAINVKELEHTLGFPHGSVIPGHPELSDPFGWIGSSIGVWFEDDPFWKELFAKKDDAERGRYLDDHLFKLPVAVLIDVSDRIKLTTFLLAARAFIEQASPGMLKWTPLSYHDQPYVKLTPTERGQQGLGLGLKDPCLLYAITPDGLLITPSQRVLEQTIDRQTERAKAKAAGKPLPAPQHPWVGDSQGLQVNQTAIAILSELFSRSYRTQMQILAWNNLAILNEWKRRFPDRDPVELNEQYWQTKLVSPGGGKYVWNEKWQTMESTVYGHPGEPKPGPAMPPALAGFVNANFGLTFENDGLRARVQLEKTAAK